MLEHAADADGAERKPKDEGGGTDDDDSDAAELVQLKHTQRSAPRAPNHTMSDNGSTEWGIEFQENVVRPDASTCRSRSRLGEGL